MSGALVFVVYRKVELVVVLLRLYNFNLPFKDLTFIVFNEVSLLTIVIVFPFKFFLLRFFLTSRVELYKLSLVLFKFLTAFKPLVVLLALKVRAFLLLLSFV